MDVRAGATVGCPSKGRIGLGARECEFKGVGPSVGEWQAVSDLAFLEGVKSGACRRHHPHVAKCRILPQGWDRPTRKGPALGGDGRGYRCCRQSGITDWSTGITWPLLAIMVLAIPARNKRTT